jgi:type IV pilus assembly protein PilA
MKLERELLVPSPQQLVPLEEGFTLVELLIVMSIIIVIMLLAIPQVSSIKKNANQTSAVQSLRVLASAEMSYNTTYPASGFGCPIAVLGGDSHSGAPSAQSSQLIPPDLATGSKSGYLFAVTCGSKTTVNNQDIYNSVEITAVPQTVGKTGDNGYCTDEGGIIRKDPAGGTNCTQPLQ